MSTAAANLNALVARLGAEQRRVETLTADLPTDVPPALSSCGERPRPTLPLPATVETPDSPMSGEVLDPIKGLRCEWH